MNKDNLVWIDLEMTGLNPDTDKIIEIATIVTDSDLNILAEGPQFVIHQSDAALDAMDDWCTEHHGNSGLTARVKASDISCAQAEQATLDFLKEWVPAGAAPLCGNSIGQDRRFMVKHMPTLEAFFHYRSIDVSTIKELGRRWAPEMVAAHKKSGTHLALQDIKESISELQHYQKHFFTY
ncbi:oligoribonuclease [Psychromonas sp. 14N.309.X.WAT.B.A12]|uniref:oligoribonuclease n=1 Tax=unclassified Psychromonas TaxID=2614957 RepID=UPI0025B11543|nr:oligoribonuclease [Psychromonas sp. 14N.309.X.WAT.B.A12]MDN2664297.1 oligoribonuclease [Psychromonas sp. 14N.309.X.WAT.B.A12]